MPDSKDTTEKVDIGQTLIDNDLAEPVPVEQELMPAIETPAAPAATVTTHAVAQADRLVELAISQNADMDKLEKLLDLKERVEKEEARKAFAAAKAAFYTEPVLIDKDKRVSFRNKENQLVEYTHATIGNIIEKAAPFLGKHGLSADWNTEQDGNITVTCTLTHSLGHSEKVSLTAGADTSGKKNSIQQIASTITYLQRYTFLAVTGLATKDQPDDDGRGSEPEGPAEYDKITHEQSLQIDAKITDNDLSREIFEKWLYKFYPYVDGNVDNLAAEHFNRVMAQLDKSIASKKKADARS